MSRRAPTTWPKLRAFSDKASIAAPAEARSENVERRAQPPQPDPQLVRPFRRFAFRDHDHVDGDLREAVAQHVARHRLDRRVGVIAQIARVPRLERQVRHPGRRQPVAPSRLVGGGEAQGALAEQDARDLEDRRDVARHQLHLGFADRRAALSRHDLAAIDRQFDLAAGRRRQPLDDPADPRLEQRRQLRATGRLRDRREDALVVRPVQDQLSVGSRKLDLDMREQSVPFRRPGVFAFDRLHPAPADLSQPERDPGLRQRLVRRVEIGRDKVFRPTRRNAHPLQRGVRRERGLAGLVERDLEFGLDHLVPPPGSMRHLVTWPGAA